MGQLIAFRALQGIGAGGLLPLAQAAIADLFPPRERGRYQGLVGSMWATAAVAGPLLGAVLTDAATWRWIFWINIPLGLVALVVVMRTMRAPFTRREHRIDYLGATLLSAGIVGVLLISEWVVAGVLGLLALAAFVAVERRTGDPILPLSLFRNRVFAIAVSAGFVIGALLFVVTIYVPVFVQGVLGASATSSGIVLIPLSLGWVAVSVAAGQVMARRAATGSSRSPGAC
jgi:MFS family permease